MISAGSAVSDSRTAPRTDCSASRFCGGAIGPSEPRAPPPLPWPMAVGAVGGAHGPTESRSASGRRRGSLRVLRCSFREIVTRPAQSWHDQRAASAAAVGKRMRERYFCSTTIVLTVAVTPSSTSTSTIRVPTVRIGSSRWTWRRSIVDPARLLDRVDDVLRRDGAEQAAVLARLVGDRQHRAVEQLRVLARARRRGRARRARRRPRGAGAPATAPFVAGSASLRGIRKLRR